MSKLTTRRCAWMETFTVRPDLDLLKPPMVSKMVFRAGHRSRVAVISDAVHARKCWKEPVVKSPGWALQ